MPHIIIETSKNILAKEALKIGKEIQQIMAKIVEGKFDPDQCKIRVINYENYQVGLEENDENFMHISIKILAGRAVEVRQKLASKSFEFSNNFYKNLKLPQKRCDISVDIIEMDRETYQKITLKK
jgi:5-carboxymethyl-2-hydroxymuconate isomerase